TSPPSWGGSGRPYSSSITSAMSRTLPMTGLPNTRRIQALSAVFTHLAVDPAAVDLDKRHQDHRSIDKPVPRLHDLGWLPRRRVKLQPRWRPDQRTGLARLLTTRRARAGDSAIPAEL